MTAVLHKAAISKFASTPSQYHWLHKQWPADSSLSDSHRHATPELLQLAVCEPTTWIGSVTDGRGTLQ